MFKWGHVNPRLLASRKWILLHSEGCCEANKPAGKKQKTVMWLKTMTSEVAEYVKRADLLNGAGQQASLVIVFI